MRKISIYFNFLREKGRPLLEMNTGSDEIALEPDDALQALALLKENQIAVLGGDILSEEGSGKLIYAYQLWGDGQGYHYLNWYCDKMDGENQEEYARRSYIIAKESIKKASDIANSLGKKCYVVIVI